MKKHRLKNLTAAFLALVLTAPCTAAEVTYTLPTKSGQTSTYNDNFTDVSRDSWYYESVKEAYSLNIINGTSSTEYSPDGVLTLAECIKLACCVHQIKNNGTVTLKNGTKDWYDTYVEYALNNSIISEEYENYSAYASRAQTAVIFARLLDTTQPPVNPTTQADQFKDVTNSTLWYFSSVYKMYAYGIMNGDNNRNFNPEGKIKRSEIAAVAVRILNSSKRTADSNSSSPSSNQPASNNNNESSAVNTDYNGEAWEQVLYTGGNDPIAYTGINGFSLIYTPNGCSGYSIECINDVVMSDSAISFIFRKNVGLSAMESVRRQLKSASAYTDGVKSTENAADIRSRLSNTVSLYINGKSAGIAALTLNNTADGNEVYTLALSDRYIKGAVTSVVIICNNQNGIPSEYIQSAENAVKNAESLPSAVYTPGAADTSAKIHSEQYTAAINSIRQSNYTSLYEYETERCMVMYGLTINNSAGDVSYKLQFVYSDGSVQTITDSRLEDIHMNGSGTVLYYSVKGADGSVIEHGINLSAVSGNTSGSNAPASSGNTQTPENPTSSSASSETKKSDIKGMLAGFNVTLSSKDTSTIALMEDEGDTLFRGVYSNRETAFSIVEITQQKYFEYYAKYFRDSGNNTGDTRLFALKNGVYYGIIYDTTASERIKEAGERVISSLTSENAFDCVYQPYSSASADFDYRELTHVYLKKLDSGKIICDPFLWIDDDTAPNGFRKENYMISDEEYKVTGSTEVWTIGSSYAPVLKTTYNELRSVWNPGDGTEVWMIEIDGATSTVTKLIQKYVP